MILLERCRYVWVYESVILFTDALIEEEEFFILFILIWSDQCICSEDIISLCIFPQLSEWLKLWLLMLVSLNG